MKDILDKWSQKTDDCVSAIDFQTVIADLMSLANESEDPKTFIEKSVRYLDGT